MEINVVLNEISNAPFSYIYKYEALSLILKIVNNVLANPTNAKYRRVNRRGQIYSTKILNSKELSNIFENLLLACGFSFVDAMGNECSDKDNPASLVLERNVAVSEIERCRDRISEFLQSLEMCEKTCVDNLTSSIPNISLPEESSNNLSSSVIAESSEVPEANKSSLSESLEEIRKEQAQRFKEKDNYTGNFSDGSENDSNSKKKESEGIFSMASSFVKSLFGPLNTSSSSSSSSSTTRQNRQNQRRTMTLNELPKQACFSSK